MNELKRYYIKIAGDDFEKAVDWTVVELDVVTTNMALGLPIHIVDINNNRIVINASFIIEITLYELGV